VEEPVTFFVVLINVAGRQRGSVIEEQRKGNRLYTSSYSWCSVFFIFFFWLQLPQKKKNRGRGKIMGKSDLYHLLKEYCPAVQSDIPPDCIFIQDAPIDLFGFSSKAEKGSEMGKLTGASLLEEMKSYLSAAMGRMYKPWLRITSSEKLFIFCLDEQDSEKVMIAKSPTRHLRDMGKMRGLSKKIKTAIEAQMSLPQMWKWDKTSPIVALGKTLPPWIDVLRDPDARKRALEEIDDLIRKEGSEGVYKRVKKEIAEQLSLPPVWTWDGKSPIVTFDGLLPVWHDVLRDRAARERALDEFVDLVRKHWSVDVGWTLIFDGHKEGAKFVMSKGSNGLRVIEECDDTDLRVSHDLGEADQKLGWYARRYWEHPTCVISKDTDQLHIQLLNIDNHRTLQNTLHIANVNDHNYYTTTFDIETAAPLYVWAGTKGKDQCIVDIKTLYRKIADVFGDDGTSIQYPVMNLLAAATTAGNDFVNGWFCLPMEKIINALLLHKEYVGDLFQGDALCRYLQNGQIEITEAQASKFLSEDWSMTELHKELEMDVEAFQRLILVAYLESYRERPKSELESIIPNRDMSLEELWKLVRSGVTACNPNRIAARVPAEASIVHNATRCWWAVGYNRFASVDMNIIPHPLHGWGWETRAHDPVLHVNEFTGDIEQKKDENGVLMTRTVYIYKDTYEGVSAATTSSNTTLAVVDNTVRIAGKRAEPSSSSSKKRIQKTSKTITSTERKKKTLLLSGKQTKRVIRDKDMDLTDDEEDDDLDLKPIHPDDQKEKEMDISQERSSSSSSISELRSFLVSRKNNNKTVTLRALRPLAH
jgi:hypothetical protein